MKHENKFDRNLGQPVQAAGRIQRSSGYLNKAAEKRGHGVRGAVRLAHPLAERRAPDLRYWMKVSAGLMFATGGVLMATTSTGTVEPLQQTHVLPPPPISFNFDDIDDALGKPAMATLEQPSKQPERSPAAHRTVAKLPAAKPPAPIAGVVAAASRPASQSATITITEPEPERASPQPATTEAATVQSNAQGSIDKAVGQASSTDDAGSVSTIEVAAGDTLSGILNREGLGLTDIRELLNDAVVSEQMARLSIGQALDVTHAPDGRFMSLSTRAAVDQRITIERDGDEFAVAEVHLPLEKERVVTSGTIQNSLYLAAAEAKLKQSTIMELADIFQWELDFARDIRKGDQFALVYDRLFRDGEYIGDGDILAAEFIRGGRTYQAVRFTTDDGTTGYYAPDGHSMRRTFLRHPVDVVRVTSRFDPNRLHPVLHQIRAHRGVDYGSPYGTPIRATADGTISFAGAQSTYGNLVILQHGHEFSTLYAHMSKVADKSVTGGKVKQGDIIGYVGNTGRVTGTHLHYEFRVRGVHVDPLKVELPAALPIAAAYRDALRSVSDDMVAQMQSVLPVHDGQLATR